jgi:hypothetical protein
LILNYKNKLLLACQVFRGLTSMKEHIWCVMSPCELWSMQLIILCTKLGEECT